MDNGESVSRRKFSKIKQTHDAAYSAINQAIKLEEQDRPQEAIEKYKLGISLIDQALSIQIEYPNPNPKFNRKKTRVMIQKMKKTRGEILKTKINSVQSSDDIVTPTARRSQKFSKIKQTHVAAYSAIDQVIKLDEHDRPQKEKMKETREEILKTKINSIQSSDDFVAAAPPPSYDETMSPSSSASGGRPRTYNELAFVLQSLKIEDTNNHQITDIFSHDNVKLYFISSDGTVGLNSELYTLRIGIVESNVEGQPTVTFLQVGDWVYPLVPGDSPYFRTEYRAFIFPDLHSEVPGSSIGIILPSEIDSHVCKLLEDSLHGILPEQQIAIRGRRPIGVSDTISQNIITGAYYIQQGLIKGAENAGYFMDYSTPIILNHVRPENEETIIPDRVQEGIEIARDVTTTAVNVTGYIASKIGCATMALGRFLAPHIQKQGTKLLTSAGFDMTEDEASEKMKGVLTVAAGAVEGFSAVYRGLETSACILGNNLTNNTVKIVEYKYGRPSGILVGNTLNTVGNLVNVSRNIKVFTPKGIAKRSVKETGKAMVQDIRTDVKRSEQSWYLQRNREF